MIIEGGIEHSSVATRRDHRQSLSFDMPDDRHNWDEMPYISESSSSSSEDEHLEWSSSRAIEEEFCGVGSSMKKRVHFNALPAESFPIESHPESWDSAVDVRRRAAQLYEDVQCLRRSMEREEGKLDALEVLEERTALELRGDHVNINLSPQSDHFTHSRGNYLIKSASYSKETYTIVTRWFSR